MEKKGKKQKQDKMPFGHPLTEHLVNNTDIETGQYTGLYDLGGTKNTRNEKSDI